MKQYNYLLLLAIAVSSCSKKEDAKSDRDFAVQGDTITVSDKSSLSGKLKTMVVNPETYTQTLQLRGW